MASKKEENDKRPGKAAKKEKVSDKKVKNRPKIEKEKPKAAEEKPRQRKPRITELEHKLAEAQEKLRQKKQKEAKRSEEGEEIAAEKPKHARESMPERPAREKKPGVPHWVELKPAEAVEAMVNLANAGHSSSEIGMMLRDQYGVPNIKALCGKSIEEILAEQKLLPEIPSDLMNLIKRSVNLRKHLAKNRKDFTAKRGLQLSVAKIRNLVTYYKRKGRLPMDWHYSEETAALLVK